KLTHRDMGPHGRLLGPDVPKAQLWQDPVPPVTHPLVNSSDIVTLKRQILASGVSTSQLVRTAWAAASSYRDTDKRGGANGARLRLAPQRGWEANTPGELSKVMAALETIQKDFNAEQSGGKAVSVADLIVLGGAAAIEAAAKKAGHTVTVPFAPGRTDATQEMTDVASFAVLEPQADGFRNYHAKGAGTNAAEALVERADLLSLSAADMTVLVGGLRVLGANHADSKHGVFTARVGALTNDFFVNLLDLGLAWRKAAGTDQTYEGVSRKSGKAVWTGTAVDLVFGSNSQLRAIAEVYAGADASEKFVHDFVAAWTRVMRLDRFDLSSEQRAARN
ncbi:MAG: catalase-peroxidase, partial [Myxococcota bacterium]